MSYILEALRRAETERERKRRVPGLHAQPVPVVSTEEPGKRRSKAWLWVVVGVSAGVLLPLLWRSWPDSASEEAANARTAVAGSVAPAADGPVAPAPGVAMPAPEPAVTPGVTATAPAPQAAHATPNAAAAVKPGTTRNRSEPATRTAPTTAATNTTAAGLAPGRGVKPTPATAPVPPPASAPEPRLRSLAELPDELRRGVPPLAFGGSVYSETAAQRMVIFNGQVLREGDAVTDDLLLEQIRPRSAVMRMRGQRFEVAF